MPTSETNTETNEVKRKFKSPGQMWDFQSKDTSNERVGAGVRVANDLAELLARRGRAGDGISVDPGKLELTVRFQKKTTAELSADILDNKEPGVTGPLPQKS